MDIFNTKFDFNNLSIKDLVEARDLFHIHLINKKNVVATAIGRYRILKQDPWPNEPEYQKSLEYNPEKPPRTLKNSEVRDYSWPCILVFISNWENPDVLNSSGQNELVPKSIFMPDGRIVPICVVEAPKMRLSNETADPSKIIFPANYIGGGYPILLESQGQQRIASVGCIVTDGNKYYAITNKHVVGTPGTPVYTKLKGITKRIGVSSDKQIGKLSFNESYQEWSGKKLVINNDIGLIEIDDLNYWKTDVFGIGQIGELANLDTSNMKLSLISAKVPGRDDPFPQVTAFGAVSGRIQGEIIALFYRYKSIGGFEYVADFLIGGVNGAPLNIHHGDSGTLWLIENKEEKSPLAIHWGQHNILSENREKSFPLALATNLTNVCVHLDVDLVRGWNIDNDYSWAKTGHFKIAAKSCELVSNKKLSKLLMANQENIGYKDEDLIDNKVVNGALETVKNEFVPLADVADLIWRSIRSSSDTSNHFADVDERHPNVFDNKSLLELCLEDDERISIAFWLDFYKKLDKEIPVKNSEGKVKPRDGALPFRIWHMYGEMIKSLKAKKLDEFICAGGTMAHYVGDACLPLHVSHLHHGRDESEEKVHEMYEKTMIDKKMIELFEGINAKAQEIQTEDVHIKDGSETAKKIIELMEKVHNNLSPETICDAYKKIKEMSNKVRIEAMWEELGDRTIDNIVEGCTVMAHLWQGAWIEGDGDDAFDEDELGAIDQERLMELYNDKTFIPSFKLKNPKFKEALLQI